MWFYFEVFRKVWGYQGKEGCSKTCSKSNDLLHHVYKLTRSYHNFQNQLANLIYEYVFGLTEYKTIVYQLSALNLKPTLID